MKLSELLEAAVLSLEMTEITATLKGYSDARMKCANNKQALRAIAPALVEFVAADHAFDAIEDADDFETADNMDTLQAANQRLINASSALQAAMKEAGVTCE